MRIKVKIHQINHSTYSVLQVCILRQEYCRKVGLKILLNHIYVVNAQSRASVFWEIFPLNIKLTYFRLRKVLMKLQSLAIYSLNLLKANLFLAVTKLFKNYLQTGGISGVEITCFSGLSGFLLNFSKAKISYHSLNGKEQESHKTDCTATQDTTQNQISQIWEITY